MGMGLGVDRSREEGTLLWKVNTFQWDGNLQLKSKESTFLCCTQSYSLSEWRKIFWGIARPLLWLACFREPVCSIMLFWPVDTLSSATTKGDSVEGRRETSFKQHILNVFFCCFHLLCCLSFEFVSHPRAKALTRLPAMVSGHTVFTLLSLQLRGQQRVHCLQ